MSRVEDILNGTYSGEPMSRIEALLMKQSNPSSGGSVQPYDDSELKLRMSSVEQRISTLNTNLSDITRDVPETLNSFKEISDWVEENKSKIESAGSTSKAIKDLYSFSDKNLFCYGNIPKEGTFSDYTSVTYKINDDGSMTIKGSLMASLQANLLIMPKELLDKYLVNGVEYRLTYGQEEKNPYNVDQASKCHVWLQQTTPNYAIDCWQYDIGVNFVKNPVTSDGLFVTIYGSFYSEEGITIYPMIRRQMPNNERVIDSAYSRPKTIKTLEEVVNYMPTHYVTVEEAQEWFSRKVQMKLRFSDGSADFAGNFGSIDEYLYYMDSSVVMNRVVLLDDSGNEIASASVKSADITYNSRVDNYGETHSSSTLTFTGNKGAKWTPSPNNIKFVDDNGVEYKHANDTTKFYTMLDPCAYTQSNYPPKVSLTKPLEFGKDGVNDDVKDAESDYYICVVFQGEAITKI